MKVPFREARPVDGELHNRLFLQKEEMITTVKRTSLDIQPHPKMQKYSVPYSSSNKILCLAR
jgi:hypothetical protein